MKSGWRWRRKGGGRGGEGEKIEEDHTFLCVCGQQNELPTCPYPFSVFDFKGTQLNSDLKNRFREEYCSV